MKRLVLISGLLMSVTRLAYSLEPIQAVSIGPQREFIVNGRPFFPIMIWLQDPANFPLARNIGVNTIAGYWPKSGGTADVVEYMQLVEQAGFYGVMPFDLRLKGHPWLLGYIHDDEPDLTHKESEAQVIPGEMLRLNNRAPLWRIVDGDVHSWAVLDPLLNSQLTIKTPQPVTIKQFNVWLTISPGLSVAKKVRFLGDGRPIIQAELQNTRDKQEIVLPAPATFQELAVFVEETYPGEQIWGSIGEIEGLEESGRNVLLCPPRDVVRQTPEQTQEKYRAWKQADPTRPIFMTLTAYFMPFFKKYPEERRRNLYTAYAQAADVLGFDVYPIYGWGRTDWIHLVSEGMGELAQLAPDKPLYAWIETSKGSQWVSEAAQKDVTPTHIKAEVWMAICQGATAIGYFTHIWKPRYAQFGVLPENMEALREINAQITRLTPVLAAPAPQRPVKLELEGGRRADVLAKKYEGMLYVFAVNSDPAAQAVRGTFFIPGLPAGQQIEVLDEERTLRSEEGMFHDDFEPLAVHLYRLKL